MQRLTLTLEPIDDPFPVPYSTGYQTYSGLLSVLDAIDEELADRLHDANRASLTNSGLLGQFDPRGADRNHHQLLCGDEYTLHLGATTEEEEAFFEALVRAFIIENRPLPLAHGKLGVTGVQSESVSIPELLETASEVAETASGVRVEFISPTCLQEYGEVWEACPDRTFLYPHLADRWNAIVEDDEYAINPTPKTLGQELYPVPHPQTYDHHSIVVYRQEPTDIDTDGAIAADGAGNHLRECQGFVGEWSFRFKDASAATRTAVIALSRFAEFAGVGRHTARGAGSVTTSVEGAEL